MTIPHSDVAIQLQQKCESGRERAAKALVQAFGDPWEMETGMASSWNDDSLPAEWDSSGLVFVLQSGQNAAVALLSEASGLVPGWCSQPDETGQSKLRLLGEELSAAFFPATSAPAECTIGRVKNLRDATFRAAPSANSAMVAFTVRSLDRTGTLWVVWPASKAEQVPLDDQIKSGTSKVHDQSGERADSTAKSPRTATRREALRYQDMDEGIELLPSYSRSLLRIRVPVTVTLAVTKQSLEAILNIGSGSIIHFNKSCEDTLTLEVAGHKVAVGETVKVGDKFGLWITSMILPDERFWVIGGRQPTFRAR